MAYRWGKLSWSEVRSSMGFIPSLLTVAACGLAVLTVWLDQQQVFAPTSRWFILVAGAEGARGVLSTIAGSIITVTGVVFSITIVVLQLAATQYSPRVLRSFTEDRGNHIVLGVFIGTFTYALLVLRTVRSSFADYERFVPTLSVNVAVVLAILSMALLIYFVTHIAHAIRAETIIQRVTEDALVVVNALFPEDLGDPADEISQFQDSTEEPLQRVTADASGFLQGIDEDGLLALAEDADAVIRLERRIGSFIIAGDVVFTVFRTKSPIDAEELIARARIGSERTRDQDVERGLIELADIAIRALSPGINDPATAMTCIDRLTEIFVALGNRTFPSAERIGRDGAVRVIAPPPHFGHLLQTAYDQIRHYAREHPAVMHRLDESQKRLVNRLPPARARVAADALKHLFTPISGSYR